MSGLKRSSAAIWRKSFRRRSAKPISIIENSLPLLGDIRDDMISLLLNIMRNELSQNQNEINKKLKKYMGSEELLSSENILDNDVADDKNDPSDLIFTNFFNVLRLQDKNLERRVSNRLKKMEGKRSSINPPLNGNSSLSRKSSFHLSDPYPTSRQSETFPIVLKTTKKISRRPHVLPRKFI
ncbi:hypothetical protein G9A89_023265 [Geosiphon pyriformis]|nr:hypothetical protein G9A89_023265 [Geosiphon pyriformis]